MPVYVIGCEGSQLVKIGYSEDPTRRIAELGRMSASPVSLLWQSDPAHGRESEAKLHRMFRAQRRHGEWFDFGEDDPVVIVSEAIDRPEPKVVRSRPTASRDGGALTEEEAGWRAPWLSVSPRVTAGADRLHEQCRRDYAANYPEEGYRPTAPCVSCFTTAAEVIAAADGAAGNKDDDVARAIAVHTHELWLQAVEEERSRDRAVLTLCPFPLPPGECPCQDCATAA